MTTEQGTTAERGATATAADNGAAALFRAVGLMADGPVLWGRPVPARGGGVFVIELPATHHHAPIEMTRVGKWLEHVTELRLDGVHPTSRALASRLEAFWLPSTRVLFIGTTENSIGGRIEAIRNTVLGDRRPHSAGHWLHALTSLEGARVWWAATKAIEESEDALMNAFAETITPAERAALHDQKVVVPFANLRTATGERKATGLANSLIAPDPVKPVPAGQVVELPPGAADGASGLPARRAAAGTVRKAPATPRPPSAATLAARARSAAARAAGRPANERPAPETTWLSAEGLERLRAEHTELTGVQRPAVIGRIKAAKELGDLKENADYTSAREEQSFLEGRIAAIEQTLRAATVIETPAGDAAARVTLGSTVTVTDETGAQMTFVVVGSAEADPTAGRISNVSPVGRALLGRSAGDDVAVAAPRGEVHYTIVELA